MGDFIVLGVRLDNSSLQAFVFAWHVEICSNNLRSIHAAKPCIGNFKCSLFDHSVMVTLMLVYVDSHFLEKFSPWSFFCTSYCPGQPQPAPTGCLGPKELNKAQWQVDVDSIRTWDPSLIFETTEIF